MPLTPSLLDKLKHTYPSFTFVASHEFLWSPDTSTIHYNSADDQADMLLLHELGHALLGHSNYHRDIELLSMETAAWGEAEVIGTTENITMHDDVIQDHLDSYRDWLHSRSICPSCGANGHQINVDHYQCIVCQTKWRVNEARTCQLRRYQLKKNSR